MINLIKDKIQELYRSKSNNIKFIGYGYKLINNEIASDMSITFGVEKKLPISQIPPQQIIPNAINVGNDFILTDVIEIPSEAIPYSGCYVCPDELASGDTTILHRIKYDSVKCGTSIGQYESNRTGTLGLIVIDNDTNKLVGLTAAHNIANNFINVTERTNETQPYNIIDKKILQPGQLDDSSSYIENTAGLVKRYYPVSKLTANHNYIDAGVFSISNIDSSSIAQIGLNNTSPIPFATTAELDSLNKDNHFIIKSGRTSGFVECDMSAKYVGVSVTVNYEYASIIYDDSIVFTYDDKINNKYRDNVYCPGDSGQAIIANINGTNKIIGIAIAGGALSTGSTRNFCVVSRIDKICSLLNVSYWDGSNIGVSSFDNWSYSQKPISPSGFQPYEIIDGKKYWQTGTSFYDSSLQTNSFNAQNNTLYGLYITYNDDAPTPVTGPTLIPEDEPFTCGCGEIPEILNTECLFRSTEFVLFKIYTTISDVIPMLQFKAFDKNNTAITNYIDVTEIFIDNQIVGISIPSDAHTIKLRFYVNCQGSNSDN